MLDNRDSMIEHLVASGLYAIKRDWAMGRTIIASRGIKSDGEISVFDGYVCLFPAEKSLWRLDIGGITEDYMYNIDSAIERTVGILRMTPPEYENLLKTLAKAVRSR